MYQQLNSNTNLKNKKIRTKILIALLIFIIMLLFTKSIYGVVKPTSDFYVNDYAKILSNETKQYIVQKNAKLYSETGAQIVVITVESLENRDIESYSTELFRRFGIGDKSKNNGLLLLLALEEREFRVEVGYGLEGILPDGKTGRFQDDYIIPYLKNNQWDEGILNGFNAFYKEVCNEYGIEDEDIIINKTEDSETIEDINIPIGVIILLILIIIYIIYAETSSGGFRGFGGSSGGSSGGFGGFSGGGGSSGRWTEAQGGFKFT